MAETINVKNLNKTYDGKTMILENFSYTFESEIGRASCRERV